ncbi:hypothetical protein AB840_00780 [Megasphaera cerevisiae DSM 20462]|jgi:carbohydrate diacid regulator|uniref:Uncharacterized protein n=1 Tax=Megasphaera cerevisiae DSM 20462 TaxID=1122219 RepID=A0A0J6X0L6_9FIRM|nr:sugar diacid recognition domain-containing protein [Megasphaera cerevisiae]KMO87702.1 hypothetical protein AB840_00780 [Megasphaera cerevisiae DSM 20462]OKY53452.1 hypothetical protein BSR42_07475 [Megasphaera cerevisiae]SJZ75598.1 carbohydrate diacid regulator [Megasphaera cerevisiae DSM 20462]
MIKINMDFAQQIVDSAKTIVGWNVNFIDPQGIILASTDEKRIGTYHEAGHIAARTRQVQTVHSNTEFKGANCGINYPVTMNGQVSGVIGITGEPSVVGQYGFLLTKICEVFLREYWLKQESFNEQERRSRLVMALIYHDADGVSQILGDTDELSGTIYTAVSFCMDCHGSGLAQEQIEKGLIEDMRVLGIHFYTCIYPNTLVCLVPKPMYKTWEKRLSLWEKRFSPSLAVGIGTWESVYHIHYSYRFSKTALKYAETHGIFCMRAENMNLELLLQSLDHQVRRQYKERVCAAIDDEELELLRAYYRHEMSIQETAEELLIHKNTLQYRLKRIQEKTGLDPRKFSDAVVLYIAGCLEA